jgi:hypothetical protein
VISYTSGNGCAATAVVTVNGVPATIGGPAGVCVGRTANFTNAVSGGVWSTSNANASIDGTTGVVTGVTAGASVITYATGSGCYKTKSIAINANPNPSVGYKIACVGLTTQLSNTTGGTWTSSDTFTAKATYAASNSVIRGVAPGTANITFTISSTGCYHVTEVTVNPVPPAITGTTNVCVGLQTTLANAQAGGSWSSSNTAYANIGSATGIVAAGTSGGIATISYSYGPNCRVTTVVTVRAIPNTISGPSAVCIGSTVSYVSTSPGGTWSSSNTSVATVVTASNPSYGVVTGVGSGATTLSYIVAPSCMRTLNITGAACRDANTTGIGDAANNVAVSLYPNPTSGMFTITAHEAGSVHLYTLDGRELTKFNVNKGETPLALPNNLATGIYMCRYNGNDGSAVMVRLVYEP